MLFARILLGLAATAGPIAAAAPLPAPSAQDPAQEFLAKWAEGMRFNDDKQLESTLARYKEAAILEFMSRAEGRATGGDASLDAWVDKFIAVWNSLYGNDFARNYDRYAQLLSPADRETRDRLVREDFSNLNRVHLKALVDKDPDVDWAMLRQSADQVAQALKATGDLYYVALARNIQGNVWNPNFHEEGSDGMKALEAYQQCLKAREDLGLTNDTFYTNCSNVTRDLKAALGIKEPGEESAEDAGPKKPRAGEFAPVAEVPPVTVALEAGFDKAPGKVVHSTDMDESNRFGWKRFGAGKVGETTVVPDVLPGVRLERLGDNKWRLEAGAEPSEDFRLSDRPVAVTVDRKFPDGSVKPYTLLLAAGTSSESFQGVNLNLQPSEGGGPVFFRSVATMSAETPFGEFVLYDMDADGRFGYEELELRWSEGLPPDTFFYRPDAMTLGKMKHSRPYGPWIQDDKGQWYQVQVLQPGEAPASVVIQPVTVDTGELVLDFSGIKKVKPSSILLMSDNSATKGLLVDLVTMKGKSYQLPVGRWVFLQARFNGSKPGEEMTVLPPAGVPIQFDVDAGEATEVHFGEPFRLATEVIVEGEQAIVSGRKLHVAGARGERYVRMMGAPLYGTEASAPGAKAEEMRTPSSEEANEDWERLYTPMDAVLELKRSDGKVEVELELKKHPWFGKLEGLVGA